MQTLLDLKGPTFSVMIPKQSFGPISADVLDRFGMSHYNFTANVIAHSVYVTKDRDSDLVVCMDQFLVETFPENLYYDLRQDQVWLRIYEDVFLGIAYTALRYLEPVLSSGITRFYMVDTDQGFLVTLVG